MTLKPFVLWILFLGAMWAYPQAQAQTCENLFYKNDLEIRPNKRELGELAKVYSPDRIFTVMNKLQENHDTATKWATRYLVLNNLGAIYREDKSYVALRRDHQSYELFLNIHHESGHSATSHRLKVDPTHPENILALVIKRPGYPIDPRLPGDYRTLYRNDEPKMHRKTAALLEQMARELIGHLRAETTYALIGNANHHRAVSHIFATVTTELLKEAQLTLLNTLRIMPYKIEDYGPGFTDWYSVTLYIYKTDGPPVELLFPVYAPDKSGLEISNLRRHLLDLCRFGIWYAQKELSTTVPRVQTNPQ